MVKNISQAIIKTVEEKVSKLEETVEDLHHKILNMQKEYDDKNSTLIARIIKMDSDKASLENRFDRVEQTERISNLRVFKLKEKPNEHTSEEFIKLINLKMQIKLTPEDLAGWKKRRRKG
ncbi:hypothetical protein JTB14_017010 [Gonioctena quinquepunctata]|nr:hypothetical protein JTB14_017010 [Gonioctena quinquepunctata]